MPRAGSGGEGACTEVGGTRRNAPSGRFAEPGRADKKNKKKCEVEGGWPQKGTVQLLSESRLSSRDRWAECSSAVPARPGHSGEAGLDGNSRTKREKGRPQPRIVVLGLFVVGPPAAQRRCWPSVRTQPPGGESPRPHPGVPKARPFAGPRRQGRDGEAVGTEKERRGT